jgi:AhpD family alkylhydroperoxidase
MAVLPPLADDQLSPEAQVVFAEIRAARQTEFINNFWRVLAHDPALLRATWQRLAVVMGPGSLDPMVKEMIYIAVSTANGCSYCIHSHSAAAKAKGMSPEQYGELLAIIAMASQTNALVTALQVPLDPEFQT